MGSRKVGKPKKIVVIEVVGSNGNVPRDLSVGDGGKKSPLKVMVVEEKVMGDPPSVNLLNKGNSPMVEPLSSSNVGHKVLSCITMKVMNLTSSTEF
ncbi:unnamed protein product [Calypogeia fissa]